MTKKPKSSVIQRARGRGRGAEYRLAKLLHGVRVGNKDIVKLASGKIVELGNKKPDVVTELFAVESKNHKDCPKYLQDIMRQAEANTPEGMVTLAVIRDKERGQYYYVMTEAGFLGLHVGEK